MTRKHKAADERRRALPQAASKVPKPKSKPPAGRAGSAPSPLREAIRGRNVKVFKKLLAKGIDLNAPVPGGEGRTPFKLAIDYRCDEIALALIEAGAKLDADDLNLVWAVCTKRADTVQRFIDAGADLNAESFMGTPLSVAAAWNLAEITRLLIEAGADVDAGSELETPLESAVEANHTRPALLLIEAGADPKSSSESRTLLTQAVHHRNREVVQALIKAGADSNERGKIVIVDEDTGEGDDAYANATPLIIAARLGENGIAEDLIAAKADLYARDEDGVSALEWAEREGHKKVVTLLKAGMAKCPEKMDPAAALIFAAEKGNAGQVRELLKAGARPEVRDRRTRSTGWTPLMLAAAGGHTDAATVLLDAGADLNACDNTSKDDGPGFNFVYAEGGAETVRQAGFQMWQTALMCAAEQGRAEVGRLLIRRGANVHATDRVKSTPLLLAAEAGCAELVIELLRAGADPNVRDRSKDSALHFAARGGHADVARAMIEAGARLELKNEHGNTPLLTAASGRWPELIKLLLDAGADLAAVNRSKETALHEALGTQHLIKNVEKGKIVIRFKVPLERIAETVRVLLEAGADPKAPDKYGETPLKLAENLAELTKELKAIRDLVASAKTPATSPDRRAKSSAEKKPGGRRT